MKEEDILAKYKIISSESNLTVFLNLGRIKTYEDFEKLEIVKTIMNTSKLSFQKLWNFLTLTPILEAWWKGNEIIAEFLVNTDKARKIYSYDHLELFINERILPLGILPSLVFDFLGLDSSNEIKFYDSLAKLNFKNITLCKICSRRIFPSEIIESITTEEGICRYCMEKLSPEQRKLIETPQLFKKRIDETWKALQDIQKEQLIFNILRESRKPRKIDEIRFIKYISSEISKNSSVFEIDKLSEEELEKLVKKLDNDYFIIWWEKTI